MDTAKEMLKKTKEVVKRIKKIIEDSGMSQTKFAKRFGIPLRTLQAWCLGERKCPVYLEKLLSAEIRRDSILLSLGSDEIDTIKFCVETSDGKIAAYYDSVSEALSAYNEAKLYAEDEENAITVYLTLYVEYTDGISTDNIYLLSETV